MPDSLVACVGTPQSRRTRPWWDGPASTEPLERRANDPVLDGHAAFHDLVVSLSAGVQEALSGPSGSRSVPAPAIAGAFTVSGRFLYEDQMWTKDGYTGPVQNLPIRHAKVEVVGVVGGLVLASGATDAAGNYSLSVNSHRPPVSFYVCCSTDGYPAGYYIKVYDNFVRVPTVRIVTTGTTSQRRRAASSHRLQAGASLAASLQQANHDADNPQVGTRATIPLLL